MTIADTFRFWAEIIVKVKVMRHEPGRNLQAAAIIQEELRPALWNRGSQALPGHEQCWSVV